MRGVSDNGFMGRRNDGIYGKIQYCESEGRWEGMYAPQGSKVLK